MNSPQDIAVVTAAAGAIAGWSGWIISRAWRARSWPTVPGKVTESHVEVKNTSSRGGMNRVVHVTYRYVVDGQAHTSQRITFASIMMRHNAGTVASEQRHAFATGTSVEVRYNPNQPNDAVIDPMLPWTFYFAFGIGAIGLIGTAVLLARTVLYRAAV